MHVAYVRNQLFKTSEPFIVDQVLALPHVQPLFIGRALLGKADGLDFALVAQGNLRGAAYVLSGFSREIQRLCRERSTNLIHAHFGVEGALTTWTAAALGIPHVTTLHGYDVTYSRRAFMSGFSPSWWRYSLVRQRFLEESSTLICVSKFVRARAIGLGARREACHVIPTGVDTNRITYSPPDGSKSVVAVGRLVEVKGMEYLIRAMRKVVNTYPSAVLRIVGDGPLRPNLQRLVVEADLDRNVFLLGSLNHASTLEIVRGSNLLALASITTSSGAAEGLGQVLIEAGAMGRPVVATASGGVAEVVEHDCNGILVRERDPEALADGILRLLDDSKLATRMSREGRTIVEERFDVRQQAGRLRELYAALCE